MMNVKAVGKSLIAAISKTALVAKITIDEFIRIFKTTDTVSLSDSGDLIKTDYCDMSYFDADYVGTIDTF